MLLNEALLNKVFTPAFDKVLSQLMPLIERGINHKLANRNDEYNIFEADVTNIFLRNGLIDSPRFKFKDQKTHISNGIKLFVDFSNTGAIANFNAPSEIAKSPRITIYINKSFFRNGRTAKDFIVKKGVRELLRHELIHFFDFEKYRASNAMVRQTSSKSRHNENAKKDDLYGFIVDRMKPAEIQQSIHSVLFGLRKNKELAKEYMEIPSKNTEKVFEFILDNMLFNAGGEEILFLQKEYKNKKNAPLFIAWRKALMLRIYREGLDPDNIKNKLNESLNEETVKDTPELRKLISEVSKIAYTFYKLNLKTGRGYARPISTLFIEAGIINKFPFSFIYKKKEYSLKDIILKVHTNPEEAKNNDAFITISNSKDGIDDIIELVLPVEGWLLEESDIKKRIQHELIHIIDIITHRGAFYAEKKQSEREKTRHLRYLNDPLEINQIITSIKLRFKDIDKNKLQSYKKIGDEYRKVIDFLIREGFLNSNFLYAQYIKRRKLRKEEENLELNKLKVRIYNRLGREGLLPSQIKVPE